MEIRVLRYFLMVAREENITRAAELLHITQPTLSRQLMQLEEELNTKLFNRGKNKFSLTDDGMLLKQRAQEIVELADKTERDFLRPEENTLAGEIAIGCGETRNIDFLSQKIIQFREKYPLVKYYIYSANADDIKDKIENGLIDIGLLIEPVDIGKYEFVRIPQKEYWGMLVRQDSSLAKKEFITPEDLIGVPIMTGRREKTLNEFANWCGKYYDKMNIIAMHNLYLNAVIMVKNNLGAFLGLDFDNLYKDLTFVPLEPKIEMGLLMVWKRNKTFSPAVNKFIDFLKHAD